MRFDVQAGILDLLSITVLTRIRVDVVQREIPNLWNMNSSSFLQGGIRGVCQLVESPSDRLRAVAVVKVEIQDNCVSQSVLSCGVSNRDMDVIQPAKPRRLSFSAMMT